jgi:hypothetical protein
MINPGREHKNITNQHSLEIPQKNLKNLMDQYSFKIPQTYVFFTKASLSKNFDDQVN